MTTAVKLAIGDRERKEQLGDFLKTPGAIIGDTTSFGAEFVGPLLVSLGGPVLSLSCQIQRAPGFIEEGDVKNTLFHDGCVRFNDPIYLHTGVEAYNSQFGDSCKAVLNDGDAVTIKPFVSRGNEEYPLITIRFGPKNKVEINAPQSNRNFQYHCREFPLGAKVTVYQVSETPGVERLLYYLVRVPRKGEEKFDLIVIRAGKGSYTHMSVTAHAA